MAGIGFQLKKLLSDDSFSGTLKVYSYSSLISSGPLIITIICVTFFNRISIESLTSIEQTYLQTLILYAFAFSLIAVGPTYLVLTRYIADEYYREHLGGFTAIYFSSVTLQMAITAPLAFLYLRGLSLPVSVQLSCLILFLEISAIWLAMIFISAAQNYLRVVHSYILGTLVALCAVFFYGEKFGLLGYLNSFALGQGVILVLLTLTIIKEFGYQESRDYFWIKYFTRYPMLLGIGVFYNLGIWIDKFCFWFSTEGVSLDRGMRHCPVYDGPMFVAFLTAVPAMAYFMVQMETDFFRKYRNYYHAIQEKETLAGLNERKRQMIGALEEGLKKLLIFQGFITGMALLASPWIAQLVGMDDLQMGVLRTGILASFLQVAYLVVGNILLYFDFQKPALLCSFLFCLLNGVLTTLSLRYGLPAFGFGYVAACLIAFAVTFMILSHRLGNIHFWTFMRQPMPRSIPILEEDH